MFKELLSKIPKTLILIALTATLIYARFGDTYFQFGSQKVVMAWGDGLKSYTNTIYHIRHDSTYSFFEGMNYPYREHIMAATELPGLAIALRFIHKNIFELSDAQVVDIIHMLLMGSLLLCALFLWLIFKKLGLPYWFAIPVAIGLTFLSPQTMRLNGHFGLSIAFVIPMILYLLLRHEEQKHWKWSLAIAFALFIAAQFHFYFFGILAALVLSYLGGSYLIQLNANAIPTPHNPEYSGLWQAQRNSFFTTSTKYFTHFAIMIGLPLLFYYFWMVAGDPVTDRSPKPSGFLLYKATLESIFTDIKLPVFQWINEHLFDIKRAQFEGRAYVGVIGGVVFLGFLLRWVWRILGGFVKKRIWPALPPDPLKGELHPARVLEGSDSPFRTRNSFLSTTLLSGILIGLFSIGFPFVLPKLEFLLDYSGPIRQFRSIGRFAWVFYFAINIFAFTALYYWVSNFKNGNLKTVSFLLIISLLSYDAFEFTYSKEFKLYDGFHFKKGAEYTTIEEIDFTRYQAILPIPYFNIGSNNFAKNEDGFSAHTSFIMGAQTGLPNIAAMLTRTSRSQTFKQWQLLGKPYQEPVIFQDYPSKKPILMIWWKKLKRDETARYEHLKQGARFLYEEKHMELYEIPLEAFEDRISDNMKAIDGALESDSLYPHNDFLSTDSLKNFVFQGFEKQKGNKPFSGIGNFEGLTTADNILFDQSIPNLQAGKPYEISLWADFGTDRFGLSLAGVLQEYSPEGKLLQEKKWYLGRTLLTCDETNWGLSSYIFKPKAVDSRFNISVNWNLSDSEAFFVDDLLIRPVGTDVYKNEPLILWKNNF